MADSERARSALFALDPSCNRDRWWRTLAAAKAAGLSVDDAIEWSRQGSNFVSERDCERTWKSLSPDGRITDKTLYGWAFKEGWKDPARDRLNGHRRRFPNESAHSVTCQSKASQKLGKSAAEVWAQCVPATSEHPYIAAKGGTPDGLRVVRPESSLEIAAERVAGWLVVPVLKPNWRAH